MELVSHESVHFLLTLGIAPFLFKHFRDWRLILACFLFGMLIDLDHLFDFFAFYGLDFDWRKFFINGYADKAEKIYVLLHGWEFVLPLWFFGKWAGKKLKIKGLEWAVFLSYLGHLLIDHFSFPHHPLAYFFFHRLLNNFSQMSFNGS